MFFSKNHRKKGKEESKDLFGGDGESRGRAEGMGGRQKEIDG